eukprot:TRINITY_DN22181_c0_g1_i1.p1 TRINITY_DN22181_c0_g1~~TRINITY_DN22181_c0_g1_i1.p1  ORF type:complete len:505 (-),score=100.19 TRINITY_DN22181_c0_g1_i1:64-1578(-)
MVPEQENSSSFSAEQAQALKDGVLFGPALTSYLDKAIPNEVEAGRGRQSTTSTPALQRQSSAPAASVSASSALAAQLAARRSGPSLVVRNITPRGATARTGPSVPAGVMSAGSHAVVRVQSPSPFVQAPLVPGIPQLQLLKLGLGGGMKRSRSVDGARTVHIHHVASPSTNVVASSCSSAKSTPRKAHQEGAVPLEASSEQAVATAIASAAAACASAAASAAASTSRAAGATTAVLRASSPITSALRVASPRARTAALLAEPIAVVRPTGVKTVTVMTTPPAPTPPAPTVTVMTAQSKAAPLGGALTPPLGGILTPPLGGALTSPMRAVSPVGLSTPASTPPVPVGGHLQPAVFRWAPTAVPKVKVVTPRVEAKAAAAPGVHTPVRGSVTPTPPTPPMFVEPVTAGAAAAAPVRHERASVRGSHGPWFAAPKTNPPVQATRPSLPAPTVIGGTATPPPPKISGSESAPVPAVGINTFKRNVKGELDRLRQDMDNLNELCRGFGK